jgi:hypothetical protein
MLHEEHDFLRNEFEQIDWGTSFIGSLGVCRNNGITTECRGQQKAMGPGPVGAHWSSRPLELNINMHCNGASCPGHPL